MILKVVDEPIDKIIIIIGFICDNICEFFIGCVVKYYVSNLFSRNGN